uniref:Uncharacterized protein n=1 Tax=viral metagenome TaxID=1070528 RepID=A0A6M3LDV4_9ZZZZ
MYYLADVNGYIGDFGNMETVNRFQELAKQLKMKELQNFLDLGFHISPKKLLKELNTVNFGFSELAEIAEDIKPTIENSKEIIILTTDIN